MSEKYADCWARVADLALTVASYRLEGRSLRVSPSFERRTTLVRLRGAGREGTGEDVIYEAGDQALFQERGTGLPLAGEYTLASFVARLAELELFAQPPRQTASRRYRAWAFESAAVDLALRQAGRSFAERSGLRPRPVRFVVSPGLGSPPSIEPVRRWLARDPGLRFKLDARSEWSDELVRELADTGAVDVVDFKGAYHGTPVDQAPDPDLYRRVAEAFPGAWLEDPAWNVDTEAALAGHRARVSWDAPIHAVEDLRELPFPPGAVNVKPSRIGSLRELFDVYRWCADRGIPTYGGGQFELDRGREQIQYLAALFHPDAPNDVAPAAYHRFDPEAELASNPLPVHPSATGFGLERT